MHNDDLIALLQPVPNQFNPHEWRDVTGTVTDLRVESHRFVMRASLPAGLYRCRLDTKPGAFDMRTAMVEMVRVPDGQRVPVGPWDLDHIHNVMAMPMAKTFVNGKLKGGLWFAMPGPEQIAAGRLWADFGFEAEAGETELVLELVERDRERFGWDRVQLMELRKDNRQLCALLPKSKRRPRVYVNAAELPKLRRRLGGSPVLAAVAQRLRQADLRFTQRCELDLAALVYLLTADAGIGQRLKAAVLELCHRPTWSTRPDPLLMGGDNDRTVGSALYYAGLALEFAAPLFSKTERRVVLAKLEEYLQKMYDFTVLQRAYMGHPTADPHSLGSWMGAAVACLCVYDELAIARKALPFFHGLWRDSLRLFPDSGKAAWATYFPYFLASYCAAAHTFGGRRPELDASPFLDNLGQALLACFETPNPQELQRGRRTVEHRHLTAFLCRFHHTPGIEAIYQAFVDRERQAAGDVTWGLFDLLFAPVKPVKPATFPHRPLFARDIGQIIGAARGPKTIGVVFSAGLRCGRRASVQLMPHNREFPQSLGSLEVTVDGTPVLLNIAEGVEGQHSALLNTLCLGDDGGGLTNGQYLNGNVPPEQSSHIRRCLITERFVYAHAVITAALHPRLHVRRAERIVVFDLKTGSVVVVDSFEGGKPVRFATHLHCSGSVTDLGVGRFRLTGGQANLIAGIKGGGKGLSDEERGEIFATVLHADHGYRVTVEEPSWVPCYIYGLNMTGQEKLSDARFPRYRRWRLAATEPVSGGAFVIALSGAADDVTLEDGQIRLPGRGRVIFPNGEPMTALGSECVAEAVLMDEASRQIALIGARRLTTGRRFIEFVLPTDVELTHTGDKLRGNLFSPSRHCVRRANGLKASHWQSVHQNSRTSCGWSSRLLST